MSAVGIQGLWKKLEDNRFRAMGPVRRFVRDHPSGAGLALTGRAHFFDSERERHKALELRSGTIELSLTEFTDDQIRSYLKKTGLTSAVPGWLPSRPLLIGYLAAKGLLQPLTDGGGGPDPASGWNRLLDAIVEREAEIEAGIDGHRSGASLNGSPQRLDPTKEVSGRFPAMISSAHSRTSVAIILTSAE